MLRLVWFEIRSRWKAMLWWSIGLSAFTAMYTFVWPDAEAAMTDLADLSIYEALGIAMQTFEDYLGSVVLLFLPLLLGIYAIVNGTKTLAGEEDQGTLELVMARPLSRSQIVTAKALAIAVAVLIILVLSGLGSAASVAGIKLSYETTLEPIQMFTAVLAGWPIVMALAMISMFLGAFTPRRRIASMIATVILVVSYVGENIAGMVDSLDWVKPISLFTYFDTTASAFSSGAEAGDVLVLLAIAVVFFVLTLVSFQRRDITVGAWPWVRARIER